MLFQDVVVEEILTKIGQYVTATLLNFILVISFTIIIYLVSKSIIKFGFVKQLVAKQKLVEPAILFGLGLLASCGTFWYYNYTDWSYLFIVIIFFVLGFNLGYWFVLGATPLIIYNAMVVYGVNSTINANIDIYQVLAFAILFGQIFIFTFIHSFIKFKSNFIYFIYNVIIFAILIGIVLPIVFTQPLKNLYADLPDENHMFKNITFSVNLLLTFVLSFLGFGVVRFIERFIYKTEKLGINVSYKNGFIIKKFSDEQINIFIDKNKINFAYIIKFSVLGIDPFIATYGYSVANKIKIDMIRDAQKQMRQFNGLFYMQGDDSEYFAILPINDIKAINLAVMKKGNTLIDRTNYDNLQFLEKILKDISSAFNGTLKLDFKINLFAHAMIYGITSNSFQEINTTLENINIMHSAYNENVVVLIDTNISPIKEYNQKNKALEQFNKFGPNDITINLMRKKNHNRNLILYESDAVLLKEFLLSKQEIYGLTKNELIQSSIICHISAKSIKAFVDQKLNKNKNMLIIDYPQYLLEQPSFNIYELISNITSYQVLPSQIILNVLISRQTFTSIFYENLNNLAKGNLKMSFTNLTNQNDAKIKKLNTINL